MDTNGGVVQGAAVQFSVVTGILIPGSVVTDVNGKGNVGFSAGATDISTRTATITASSNCVSTQIPILISGSTIDVTSPINSLPDNGSSTTTLTVQVKDAGGGVVRLVFLSRSASLVVAGLASPARLALRIRADNS